MATIRYSADGAISPERFIAALTDFSDRRPERWPNLDTKWFKLHERGETWAEVTEGTDVLGGVWARERYDWSESGRVVLRVVESPHFRAGTTIEYTVTRRPGGGCHVDVASTRIPTSIQGRLIGWILQIIGTRRFATDLRTTLDRVERATQAAYAAPLILLAGNRQSIRDRLTLEHAASQADVEERQNEELLRDGKEIVERVAALEQRILDLEERIVTEIRASGPRPAG